MRDGWQDSTTTSLKPSTMSSSLLSFTSGRWKQADIGYTSILGRPNLGRYQRWMSFSMIPGCTSHTLTNASSGSRPRSEQAATREVQPRNPRDSLGTLGRLHIDSGGHASMTMSTSSSREEGPRPRLCTRTSCAWRCAKDSKNRLSMIPKD